MPRKCDFWNGVLPALIYIISENSKRTFLPVIKLLRVEEFSQQEHENKCDIKDLQSRIKCKFLGKKQNNLFYYFDSI